MNIEDYIASGILESYVLGETTEQENALLQCLVKTNPLVASELKSIQESFELLAQENSIEAPLGMKEQIWRELENSTQTTKEIPLQEKQTTTENPIQNETKIIQLNWLKYAASFVLIVFSSSYAFYFYFQNKSMNEQIAKMDSSTKKLEETNLTNTEYLKFLAHTQTKKVMLAGVPDKPNAKAVVFWNKENKHVMLSEIDLPKAPKDMQYQLWALVDGKPIDAGVLDLNPEGKLLEMKTIENSQAFAITLEPMGGSPSPHLDDLCVIGNLQ